MGWESSDVDRLTLVSSFKVKRWFTGFGELSFRWIQICYKTINIANIDIDNVPPNRCVLYCVSTNIYVCALK